MSRDWTEVFFLCIEKPYGPYFEFLISPLIPRVDDVALRLGLLEWQLWVWRQCSEKHWLKRLLQKSAKEGAKLCVRGLVFPIFMPIFNKMSKRWCFIDYFDGLGSVRLTVGLGLKGLFQPKWFYDFLLPTATESIWVGVLSDCTVFLPNSLHPFLWILPMKNTRGNDHIEKYLLHEALNLILELVINLGKLSFDSWWW